MIERPKDINQLAKMLVDIATERRFDCVSKQPVDLKALEESGAIKKTSKPPQTVDNDKTA